MIRAALARNVAPPGSLVEGPELHPDVGSYWSAFWTLCRGRAVAVGMAAIEQRLTYTDVSLYAGDHGFKEHPREFARFTHLIYAMDRVYLEAMAERRRQAQDQKPQPPDRGVQR